MSRTDCSAGLVFLLWPGRIGTAVAERLATVENAVIDRNEIPCISARLQGEFQEAPSDTGCLWVPDLWLGHRADRGLQDVASVYTEQVFWKSARLASPA